MVLAGTVGAPGICVIQDKFETLEQRYLLLCVGWSGEAKHCRRSSCAQKDCHCGCQDSDGSEVDEVLVLLPLMS